MTYIYYSKHLQFLNLLNIILNDFRNFLCFFRQCSICSKVLITRTGIIHHLKSCMKKNKKSQNISRYFNEQELLKPIVFHFVVFRNCKIIVLFDMIWNTKNYITTYLSRMLLINYFLNLIVKVQSALNLFLFFFFFFVNQWVLNKPN